MEVIFDLDLPPSVNEQFIKTRRRENRKAGMALAEAAKKFQNHIKSVVAQNMAIALGQFPVGDPEIAYRLEVVLHFSKLENEGWFQVNKKGAHAGERKAQTRFVRVDTDNRLKFLKDQLCKSVGIPDDCQIFDDRIYKVLTDGEPRTVVRLSVINVEDYLNVHKGGHGIPRPVQHS